MFSRIFVLSQLVLSSIAFAGVGSTGGGNAVGGTLFDFYENQGTTRLELKDIEALPAYQQVVVSRLEAVGKHLPAFSKDLLSKFGSKNWFFETKEITDQSCRNKGSMVITPEQKIVACQDEFDVRIDKAWFESTDLTNQGGLLVHELLVAKILKIAPSSEDPRRPQLEANVRSMNRMIFGDVIPDSAKLSDIVWERGLGDYLTVEEMNEAGKIATQAYEYSCAKDRGRSPQIKYVQKRMEELTASLRKARFELWYALGDAMLSTYGGNSKGCSVLKAFSRNPGSAVRQK